MGMRNRWTRWVTAGALVAAAVLPLAAGTVLVVASPPTRATAATAAPTGPALVPDVRIGPIRVGESRAQVERALGPGRNRTGNDPLGSCSFGFCRVYRIDGALVGVDYDRDTKRVIDVVTKSPDLVVGGRRVGDGLAAAKEALPDWRVLPCDGGGTFLVHTSGRNGPTSTLAFQGEPFFEASVYMATAPSGCGLSDDPGTKTVTVPWTVLETGPGARSLVLRWRAAPCGVEKGHPVAAETATSISIRVEEKVQRKPVVCTSDLYTPTGTVRLHTPLAGRRITGPMARIGRTYDGRPVPLAHPQDWLTYLLKDRRFHALLPEAPRVLGLAPSQAVRVLALQGFRTRVSGHGREVVAQDPGRGVVPKDTGAGHSAFAGTVRLTVGR